MTVKIDGTNGVLQAYDYQVLTTGFSYTFAAGTQVLVAVPAGTLATGTVTMPSAPADGMVITIQSSQQITALTLNANTGQSLVGTAVQISPNAPLSWVYRLTNTTWYPFAGEAGRSSSVVTGISVASTSGTSVSFSSIPSWVKRVTIMLAGVSTNGASNLAVQIGPVAGVETTGYSGYAYTPTSPVSYTTEWAITGTNSTANVHSGNVVICLADSATNTWVMSSSGGGVGINTASTAGGSKAIAGTLSVLRIIGSNTGAPVDTFDLGLINILYE